MSPLSIATSSIAPKAPPEFHLKRRQPSYGSSPPKLDFTKPPDPPHPRKDTLQSISPHLPKTQLTPAPLIAGVARIASITELIEAGGDTDTTAAIAGALCGSHGGSNSIPQEWITGINEWPTSMNQLSSLARAISHRSPLRIRPRWSPLLLLRKITFLGVVLFHGFARLVPRKG